MAVFLADSGCLERGLKIGGSETENAHVGARPAF
jgi:hypothetical protein